jgi:hypothetical protein
VTRTRTDAESDCDGHRWRAADRTQNIEHLLLGGDREIVSAVARTQDTLDARAYGIGGRASPVNQIDLHETFAVENLEGFARWHIHGVVEVESQKLALGFHDTDDPESTATNA